MPLPLMPGDEPIEVKFKPQEAYVAPPQPTQPVRRVIPGCHCSYCTDLRAARAVEYSRGMPLGMIRGRYDLSQSPTPQNSLHGQVRWRAPGSMDVFNADGCRQWTYREELPNGTLIDGNGRRWVPDPVPVGLRPPVSIFNWDSDPV